MLSRTARPQVVIGFFQAAGTRNYGHRMDDDIVSIKAAKKHVYVEQKDNSEVWQLPFKREYGLTKDMVQEYKETILDKPNYNWLNPDMYPDPDIMRDSFDQIQYPSDARFPSWRWEHLRHESVLDESGTDNKVLLYKTHRTFFWVAAGVIILNFAKANINRLIDAKGMRRYQFVSGATEVCITDLEEGHAKTYTYRTKPLFVYHRKQKVIEEERAVDVSKLRDPEPDEVRHAPGRPEWMVCIGVCTHLGCIPIFGAGDFNGWFCPCHGSHYDSAGRIRKGPAPANLEKPDVEWIDENNFVCGKAS